MSHPMTLEHVPPVPRRRRLAARAAVGAAVVLSRLRPDRLDRALRTLRRGARPATHEEAATARQAVVAVSVHCAGQGCLRRSLATAVLCRLRGTWPTWCAGVRLGPFRAHAWVEAGGRPVDEPHPTGYFTPTLTVPPPAVRSATVRGGGHDGGVPQPQARASVSAWKRSTASSRTRPWNR